MNRFRIRRIMLGRPLLSDRRALRALLTEYPGVSGTAREAPSGSASAEPPRPTGSTPPIQRPQAWWLERIATEPDVPIGAGVPDIEPVAPPAPPPAPRRELRIDLRTVPSAMEQRASKWGGPRG